MDLFKQYKNLIFDLGGVILNIDFDLTVKAFENIGIKNIKNIYEGMKQSDIFDNLEKGLLSKNDFINSIIDFSGMKLSESDVLRAFNALLLDFPKERVETIANLKSTHRIFLLSNTNAIHYEEYNRDFENQFGMPIDNLFHKAYFSHETGIRKPDRQAFKMIINENGLKENETLFIDDAAININAASNMGIHTLHVKQNTSFFDYE